MTTDDDRKQLADASRERVNKALIHLWTLAGDHADYDKSKWMELSAAISSQLNAEIEKRLALYNSYEELSLRFKKLVAGRRRIV
jgi:hypothetical protein